MQSIVLVGWPRLDLPESVESLVDHATEVERALWVVVIGAVVLDIATTAYGLSVGLVERNPVMRHALESFGIVVLPLAKAAAVAVALVCRSVWPEYALLAPLGLAVPWVLAVGINLAVILTA